jgi:phosphatidylglycerol lysyltransferase
MTRLPGHTERRMIAIGALALGLFNLYLTAFPAPFSGLGQFEDVVERGVLNGSRFVLVIDGVLLLSTVPGLLHGKRAAWAVALAACVVSVLAHPLKHLDLWGTFASVSLAGVLLGARPQFPARSDPPRASRGAWFLAWGLGAVFAYSMMGLYLMDRQFRHPVSFVTALRDSFRLLFIVPATDVTPRTHHGVWFLDSVRVAFLAVMVLGVTQMLAPVIRRASVGRAERDRVRTLLERYGRSSIAYFALLPDKAYFFSHEGGAVVAFKVVGSTAVVLGDPIGDESQFAELIREFREHCELDGWALAFHQATPGYLELYAKQGLKALKIGEEGVVDLATFTLSGNAAKHLRATMNRFEREGYRAEALEPPHNHEVLRELKEISDEWLAQGKRRERTFTLGQFDTSTLQECPIMVARGPDGRIAGFANVIPSYRSTDATFDLLRYCDQPKAVADFLCISLIHYFRERDFKGMNLGLSPFSGLDVARPTSPAERAMSLLYRRGTFLFRYTGLRGFKEKFQPAWEPRYLIYGSELQLPGIALAVAGAGELRRGPHIELPHGGGATLSAVPTSAGQISGTREK